MVRQVWAALKQTFLFWLGVMSLLVVCTLLQYQRREEAEQVLSQLEAQWQQRQQQAAYQQRFAAEIATYLALREQWQNIGVMSPLNVPAWEKALAEMQQASGLSHLRYEFLPTTPCDLALCLPQASTGQQADIKVMLSRLQLAWSVKHEADILAWLQALAKQYAGAIKVHHCVWTVTPSFVQIDAQCELHLFNFPDVFPNPSPVQP